MQSSRSALKSRLHSMQFQNNCGMRTYRLSKSPSTDSYPLVLDIDDFKDDFPFDALFGNLVNKLLPSYLEEETDASEGHGANDNGHLRTASDGGGRFAQGILEASSLTTFFSLSGAEFQKIYDLLSTQQAMVSLTGVVLWKGSLTSFTFRNICRRRYWKARLAVSIGNATASRGLEVAVANLQDYCNESVKEKNVVQTSCDYSNGEWIPNNLGPLYNGTTCDTIKTGQNCMVYGRPDEDYLHWKWKPKTCELPRFDPIIFLKLLKNKHVAFVGDSLARNQLESLLCMLATVSKPNLYYTNGDDNKFRKWHFDDPHNVNVSIYWSPFLVSGVEKTNERNYNTLYLDLVDENWAKDLENIDMLVLSVGHWYLYSGIYYNNNSVLGCHFHENCTEIGFYDIYGKALKTVFQSVIEKNYKHAVSVFLTTYQPHHFEGEWDKFGACPKTRPYKESEYGLEGMNEEMRKVGVKNVREVKLRADIEFKNNVRFEALDVTKMALLRPDGHPGPYKNPFPFANGILERVQNDCVHWCLPGPIDTWNEILLAVIKQHASEDKGKR
ncbi:protein altered xyloglucan 4 [Phtheirospermum japonicum]|uniref:Protein altered xyloglucan 4 n=1 Tax=Phtheirospermum japonicum TaxID=374723 RepID=A0A830B638_9LAMI|nr:protein altered xyloglucan 4 [Phtheirospermum japonicum]